MSKRASLVCAALALACPQVAQAQTSRARELAIPPCTLAEAIDLIARHTGTSIGTTNPLLLKRRILPRRVSGDAERMLRQVLGEGAKLRRVSSDVWIILGMQAGIGPVPAGYLRPGPATAARALPQAGARGPDIVVVSASAPPPDPALVTATRLIGAKSLDLAAGLRGAAAVADRTAVMSATHPGPGLEKLFLRGVADSSLAGTRAATVAQFLGSQRLTYRAPDPGLIPFDLQAVTIEAGPHGTDEGAGAMGGVVRYTPAAPDPERASGRAWAGASATWHGAPGADIGALANLPVVAGKAAVRVLGYHSGTGGYIDDLRRGRDDVNRVSTSGGRAIAGWTGNGWSGTVTLAAQTVRSRDAAYAQPGLAGPLAREVASAEPSADRIAIASATVQRTAGPVRIAATVGAVRQVVDQRLAAVSLSGEDVTLRQNDTSHLFTADLRAWREAGDDGRPGWLIGLGAISHRASQARSVDAGEPGDLQDVRNDNREFNAFGEVSLPAAPGLVLSAGMRIVRTSLDGLAHGALNSFYFSRETDPVVVHRVSTRLLPSLSARLDTGGPQLFARYGQGYRPGGVAGGFVSREFRGDRLATLEAGLRGLHAGPLRFDATLAWNRWHDVQGDLLTLSGLAYTENLGDARILTADMTATAKVTARLELEGAAMVVDQHLRPGPVAVGVRRSLPNVPGESLRGAVRYALPLGPARDLQLTGTLVHDGKSSLATGADLDAVQGPLTRVDLSGRIRSGAVAVSLAIENLLDSRSNRFALGNPFLLGAAAQAIPQRPRTVRLGIESAF